VGGSEKMDGVTNWRVATDEVPLDQIEQLQCAKLLGILLCDTLNFDAHLAHHHHHHLRLLIS